MTYEDYVGLLLNAARIRMLQTATFVQALAAQAREQLDGFWEDLLRGNDQ